MPEKNTEREALWREAKKEFPNDLSVISGLMYALQSEWWDKNADEIIECGERILKESTDDNLRYGAIQSLTFTYYYGKKDVESAKKYAAMAPIFCITVNELMPRCLEGDEAVRYCQTNIQMLVELIGNNAMIMLGKGEYSDEDRKRVVEFVISYYEMLYTDGNFGFYHTRISDYYKRLADCYLKLGKGDQMFHCLEKATEHAVKYDTRQDGMYTALMVSKVVSSVDDAYKNFTGNNSAVLVKQLYEEKYSCYKDDPRMQKIIEKLSAVAKTD